MSVKQVMMMVSVPSIILFAAIESTNAEETNALQLNLCWKGGKIEAKSASLQRAGEVVPRAKRGSDREERYSYRVLSRDGTVLYDGEFQLDRGRWWDKVDPKTRKWEGGYELQDEMDFQLSIPYSMEASEIRFYPKPKAQSLKPKATTEAFGKYIGSVKLNGLIRKSKKQNKSAPNWNVEKVVDNGPDDGRLVFIFLGDGYTASEIEQYKWDVDIVLWGGESWGKHYRGIFEEEPWAEYKEYVNVYRVDVISNESGVDCPVEGVYKDTALDSTCTGHTNRDKVDAACTLVSANSPYNDRYPIFIIQNDLTGGWGGGYSIFGNARGYPEQAAEQITEMAKHECAHTFSLLTDEYHTWYGVTPGINATDTMDKIPWKIWIEPEIPLPTPDEEKYHDIVGLFPFYWLPPEKHGYKPQWDCIMGPSGKTIEQKFCAACREAHILRMYELLPVIGSYTPQERNVALSEEENKSFSIELPYRPRTHDLEIVWDLDGEVVGIGTTAITINCSQLKNDFSKLTVSVRDGNEWVRDRLKNGMGGYVQDFFPHYPGDVRIKTKHWNLLHPRTYPRVDVWGERIWNGGTVTDRLKLHYQVFPGSDPKLNYGDGYVALLTERGNLKFLSHEMEHIVISSSDPGSRVDHYQNKFSSKSVCLVKGVHFGAVEGTIGDWLYLPSELVANQGDIFNIYSVVVKVGGNPRKLEDRGSSLGESNFGYGLWYLPPNADTIPW